MDNQETAVRALYQQLLEGWNKRIADEMAAPFAEDGELIGFDGSQILGKTEIVSHLKPIFDHHVTPPYYGKVKAVRLLGPEVAVLRAIAGMVPVGKSDIQPELNTHHTMTAVKHEGEWQSHSFRIPLLSFMEDRSWLRQ